MDMDIRIEHPGWDLVGFEPLVARAAVATLTDCGLDPEICEIAVLATGDAAIATLNEQFRDKPTATNVLSWPAQDLSADVPGGNPTPPQADAFGDISLGDIAIAWETCAQEADIGGITLHDHVTHLIVHGLLHLLGYDHIRDPDATLMERLEGEILGKLGVSDPYTRADGL